MIDKLIKSNKFIVAIIPARSGSKGLANKNIRLVKGKPLLSYTIEAAKKCTMIDKTVVSTDSEEIAKIAIECGAEVPFLRAPELSGDKIPCNPVIRDCHQKLEALYKREIDIVLYMQPTEIFRKQWMLEKTINALLIDNECDSSFVAYASHKNFWLKKDEKLIRLTEFNEHLRQEKVPIFREDTGLACAIRRDVVLNGKRIGNKVKIIPHNHELGTIDIHSEQDLIHVEALLSNDKITVND